MNPPEDKTPEARFEEAWKRWAERPPRQSPAEAAARLGRLVRERGQRRQYRWAFAAAAAALIATIALAIQWLRLSPRPVPPQPAIVVQKAPNLGEGEVLMWIDKDTPLYMTFQPPENDRVKGGGKL